MTLHYDNADTLAKKILDTVGKKIVIAAPLALGKPITLLNALYRLAEADPTIQLTIITALTFARPLLKNELEKRFIEPILNRLLKNYEDPLYEHARELQKVPENIQIIEFFLSPGKYLHNAYVQQNYISSNYSNIIHDLAYYEINVVGVQVARSETDPTSLSLSSNSDLFYGSAMLLEEQKKKYPIALVAEVNMNLPFMHGAAILKENIFTEILDTKTYPTIFPVPHDVISIKDHLIGLYTSTLIKDDGCLQIGIGRLSIAVANALIMRHEANHDYKEVLDQLNAEEKFGKTIAACGSMDPFEKGLYASTEMLGDEYMQLYKKRILKKRVYDHIGLQKLLNVGLITEIVTPKTLDCLVEYALINPVLTHHDVEFLKHYGIFKSTVTYQEGKLIISSGEKISTDLSDLRSKHKMLEHCLDGHLKTGKIIHAGFFLGTADFYQQLRDLTIAELESIDMTAIARTNSLLWSPELLSLQRKHARFVNSSMMVTLAAGTISDGLKDMQEVSGVGGQFDFIAMAQQLSDARSIINCHSVRESKSGIQSNVLWEYTNLTAPRFFRDIIVTEYGIADCRSKTDCEIIKSMLNVADSRFQAGLLKQAKKAGKIPQDYQIPELFRQNLPEVIEPIIRKMQEKTYFKVDPFGSDMTTDEMVIMTALLKINKLSGFKLLRTVLFALFYFADDAPFEKYLKRMGFDRVKNLKEFFYKKLLKFALRNDVVE